MKNGGFLHCKSPPFFTKWCGVVWYDLSYRQKLLDMLYIDPRGVRGGIALIFFWKSVFQKHPTVHQRNAFTILVSSFKIGKYPLEWVVLFWNTLQSLIRQALTPFPSQNQLITSCHSWPHGQMLPLGSIICLSSIVRWVAGCQEHKQLLAQVTDCWNLR